MTYPRVKVTCSCEILMAVRCDSIALTPAARAMAHSPPSTPATVCLMCQFRYGDQVQLFNLALVWMEGHRTKAVGCPSSAALPLGLFICTGAHRCGPGAS